MKFATGTVLDPEHVHVEESGDDQLPEAHIGLLRNHHTYRAEIPITHSLGTRIIAQHPQFNIYVRVIDVSATEELQLTEGGGNQYSNTVTVSVKTIKEGSIREKIELVSEEDPGKTKEVLVTAKVLLTNQGNPMLKDGVHMLSHEHSDESDFTEWPGHGRDAK